MPGRLVYKLGQHTLKVKAVNSQGQETSTYVTLPILSRCLEKTGDLLRLDKATEEDIKVTKQVQRGGGTGGQGGGSGGSQGGQGSGGQQGGGDQQGQGGSEEIVYYRLGSWRADRIILVYTQSTQSGQGGSGGGGQGGQGGQGSGGSQNQGGGNQNQGGNQQQQQQKKRKTLQIPIPSWAPNYKVIPVLFSKAREAGLEVVGAYRHGYLIPGPAQLGTGNTGGGGGNG